MSDDRDQWQKRLDELRRSMRRAWWVALAFTTAAGWVSLSNGGSVWPVFGGLLILAWFAHQPPE
jgi:hypothetical protein